LCWILLVFGLILVAGIYLVGRRGRMDKARRLEPGLGEPVLERDTETIGDESFAADGAEPDPAETRAREDGFDFESLLAEVRSAGVSPAQSRTRQPTGHYTMLLEDEFVVIHLMVAAGSGISGSRLYTALHELGFELEEDEIFHYRESECPLIVVNAFKPGTFPPDPDDFVSGGFTFILMLSRASNPPDSFDEMVTLAYELKTMLNIQLFDMQRSSLTKQTIALLEEEVGEYQRRREI
jgi:cell division protein ZipA